jgi:ATP-dependent Lon protease
VLQLDEVSKLGSGFHGNPAAALLEVVDPDKNANFRDSYLGLAFDLCEVTFIATANVEEIGEAVSALAPRPAPVTPAVK